jgi:hypothetical protein
LATGDVLLFVDADVLIPVQQIQEVERLALEQDGAVLPMDSWAINLDVPQCEAVLSEGDFEQFFEQTRSYLYDGKVPLSWGSPVIGVSRSTFDLIGRWDEGYSGWGEEDLDFFGGCAFLSPTRCVPGTVYHLQGEVDSRTPAFTEGTEAKRLFDRNKERLRIKRERLTTVEDWARVSRGGNLLKIAVYAPAKNEAHNIEEWAKSAKGADEIVLLDTGSTDGTLELARKHRGIKAHQAVISPWRFDDGMNAALWHVSPDIDVAICLHLDDRLEPGWREEIEKAGLAGQYTFNYKWSDELTYRHDRIHARHGYRWTGAAHEALDGPGPKVNTDLWMTQHRDLSKDRSQDPDLIHLAYRENKTPRTTYYSAREHYYKDEWGPAREKFLEYLAMPGATYDQERAEACRIMARMVWPAQKEAWLLRACSEAPQRREPWAELALMYKEQGRGMEASGAAARAMSIRERTPENSFHCEDFAWSDEILGALLLF